MLDARMRLWRHDAERHEELSGMVMIVSAVLLAVV
jgi:hypothetical protein